MSEPTKEQKLEQLQALIEANDRDRIRKVGLPFTLQQWWNRYLSDERKALAEVYKALTGNDLDPVPEPAKSDGGGDGKRPVTV
jgi:hypothetical protein